MTYVFINQSIPQPGELLTLSPAESHHLVSVLRIKEGKPLIIFNRLNQAWQASIEEAHPKKAVIKITASQEAPPKKPQLHLVQALPKGKVMEDLIRKAVEIGVSHFHPITTERTEVHLKPDRVDKKSERWDHIAIEACKQSGNVYVPHFSPLQTLHEFLKTIESNEAALCVASLESHAKLLCNTFNKSKLQSFKAIYWLIGPEGDFSPNEYKVINEYGFQPVRLADNVLKVETAVTYALSITDFFLKQKKASSSLASR